MKEEKKKKQETQPELSMTLFSKKYYEFSSKNDIYKPSFTVRPSPVAYHLRRYYLPECSRPSHTAHITAPNKLHITPNNSSQAIRRRTAKRSTRDTISTCLNKVKKPARKRLRPRHNKSRQNRTKCDNRPRTRTITCNNLISIILNSTNNSILNNLL